MVYFLQIPYNSMYMYIPHLTYVEIKFKCEYVWNKYVLHISMFQISCRYVPSGHPYIANCIFYKASHA